MRYQAKRTKWDSTGIQISKFQDVGERARRKLVERASACDLQAVPSHVSGLLSAYKVRECPRRHLAR